jgi:hypothetical protein
VTKQYTVIKYSHDYLRIEMGPHLRFQYLEGLDFDSEDIKLKKEICFWEIAYIYNTNRLVF